MVKLALSYFYQIRNFKSYMVPVSTAVWDPKWYHNFGKDNVIFVDKRGVINGLRYKPLMPGAECDGLCSGPENCVGKNTPDSCKFLKTYKEQLSKLDMDLLLKEFEDLEFKLKEQYNINRDLIFVLMVYETPINLCSERNSILEWFNNNGYPLEELQYPIKENY